MTLRYGAQKGGAPVAYGETLRLPGGADATYLPAGHVLGSAHILLDYAGERVIVTGDYKRLPHATFLPFVPTSCVGFVTQATFALPGFRHPPLDARHGDAQGKGVSVRVDRGGGGSIENNMR